MQLVDMFPENRPDCHALQAEVDIFVGAHHEMITDGMLEDVIQVAVQQRSVLSFVYQSYRLRLTDGTCLGGNE